MNKLILCKILQESAVKGTGFMVSPDILCTAKHLVTSFDDLSAGIPIEKNVNIEFDDIGVIPGRTLNLSDSKNKWDFVLIRLDQNVEEEEKLILEAADHVMENTKVTISGFPKLADGKLTISGYLKQDGENYRIEICKEDQLQSYEGFSGSPVLVNGNVIGIVRLQEGMTTIVVLPILSVIDLFPECTHTKRSKGILKDISCDFDIDKLIAQNRLSIQSVGPRYRKELNVETVIRKKMHMLLDAYALDHYKEEVVSSLDDILRIINDELKGKEFEENFLASSRGRIILFEEQIHSIKEKILSLEVTNQLKDKRNELITATEVMNVNLQEVFNQERQSFEEKNGRGTYLNKSWRGFMASSMCIFPTRYLDAIRDMLPKLQKLIELLKSDEILTFETSQILIEGKGGTGKTHLLCDISEEYNCKCLPSVFIEAKQFEANDPVTIMRERFCPQNNLDDFLWWINSYGENNKTFIPICIDAINEINDVNYWNTNLRHLAEIICKYPYLKLVCSCRSIYKQEYLDDELLSPMIQLKMDGFIGVEEIALTKFTEFYGVSITYSTVNIPTFMNPLFLTMMCQIAADSDDRALVVYSLEVLMEKYFALKDKILARKYPGTFSVRDHVIKNLLNLIAKEMQIKDTSELEWNDLRNLVKSFLESYGISRETAGIMKFLISENLLRESDSEEGSIIFAYQKFFDYIRARELSDKGTSDILTLIEQGKIDDGTLEILFILYFEKRNSELYPLCVYLNNNKILKAFVSGLYWRNEKLFGSETVEIVDQIFRDSKEKQLEILLPGLLEIATKSQCPLNAFYLHQKLSGLNELFRSYFISYFFLDKYNEWKVISELCERAIFLENAKYDEESVYLWKIILGWATSSNDIRLRDKASKGLTNLFCLYPNDIIDIINLFLFVPDDYIHERLWQSAYATVVILNEEHMAGKIIRYMVELHKHIELPKNVLIRDSIRNIFEFALYREWIDEELVKDIRPVYKRKKRNSLACSKASKTYINEKAKEFSQLFWNCTASDFAWYTIPSDIEDYEISKEDLGNIIFEKILQLGYNKDLARYDDMIDYKYGSLRSRDPKIERIGKKYQKIFLSRELGNIYDNHRYRPKYPSSTIEIAIPEQGNDLRTIDLTIREQCEQYDSPVMEYPFFRYSNWDNKRWFNYDDILTVVEKMMEPIMVNGEEYISLEFSPDCREKTDNYRRIWIQIRTYLYDYSMTNKLASWLQNKDFEGRWMPESSSIYHVQRGEYPWSPEMLNYFAEDDEDDYDRAKAPCKLYPTANLFNPEKDTELIYDERLINAYAFPGKCWYNNLPILWDGANSYTVNGNKIFINTTDGDLFINKLFLVEYLKSNRMGLLLTVLGEKDYFEVHNFSMNFPGRREFSYSYILNPQTGKFLKNHEFSNVQDTIKR